MGKISLAEAAVRDADSTERARLRAEVLGAELERRLEIFETIDDDEFGRFTRVDWVICTLGFFVLPILVAWWAL